MTLYAVNVTALLFLCSKASLTVIVFNVAERAGPNGPCERCVTQEQEECVGPAGRTPRYCILLKIAKILSFIRALEPVYTEHQRKHCVNSQITTHFRAILLFSKKTESLASLQSFRNIDTDVWCMGVP